jgi:hypothetical protein
MRYGFRRPSFKKRVAARTSWKRVVRHSMGFKAPRGYGWLTNPKKAVYNRIYNRTSRGCLISLVTISILLASIFLAITSAFAGDKSVYVHGYTRKDGTYVDPHYRSAPGTASHSGTSPNSYAPSTATESTTTTSVPVAPIVPPIPANATVHVHGYYKPDGTYVQEFIRSAPGTADTVISTTSRKRVNATTSAAANTATASAVASPTPTAHVDPSSGAQRDSNGRIRRSEASKHMNLCE